MTKRDKQASEYAAESYGKGDEMRGDSDTDRCASQPRDGALCQDLLQKNLTLTDAEREAIECGIQAIGLAPRDDRTLAFADTLQRLLERTK